MPLLSDAKTCYVGTTPITNIYAGTQLVWGALQLRMVNFVVPGQPGTFFGAEFAEREECVDCAEMKATYDYRWYALSGWTAWQQFSGWRTNTDGLKAYVYVGTPGDSRFQDGFFELRTNGKVERITIDLPSVPNVGTITPELSC